MSLHVRVSTMYGGKTMFLVRLIESLGRAYKILYINHSFDTRNELGISTHSPSANLGSISTLADVIQVSNLSEISDDVINTYPTICIDEGQFFPDLVERVLYFVETLGKEVYVVGLKGDYKRGKFGKIGDLMEVSDTFSTLESMTLCDMCLKESRRTLALFTHRLNDASGQQIEIGAANYIPVCRNCYKELNA